MVCSVLEMRREGVKTRLSEREQGPMVALSDHLETTDKSK